MKIGDRFNYLEYLNIVQSKPLADIPGENPALFHSDKTGS